MKNILPYENIVYETHLSENDIQNRINDIIRIQDTYKGCLLYTSCLVVHSCA